MCICPRSTQSVQFVGSFNDNHFTHSLSSIEHVVASNKVVSTCKNPRSAHVEIPKVEMFRMRAGGREGTGSAGRPGDQRRPPTSHEVNACLVYLCLPKYVPELLQFSPRLLLHVLVFIFLILRRLTLFEGCTQLSCMLPCLEPVYAKGMKSAQVVEGVYWVMMGGASMGLRVFMKS